MSYYVDETTEYVLKKTLKKRIFQGSFSNSSIFLTFKNNYN